MIRWAAAALVALALAAPIAGAQDTVASYRHLLSLDLSRVKPFQRSYEMLVKGGGVGDDSAHVIGQRDIRFAPSTYAGNPAWLLVETRTGIVPAAESLYLAPDMRPIHWASSLGRARLSVEFVGDSLFGATTTPGGKHNLIVTGRPDLLVSLAMLEVLVPLLPLTPEWSDSTAALAVDATSATVVPAELHVEAMETGVDSAGARPGATVVALRTESSSAFVRLQGGEVIEVIQLVPAHVGRVMEYRLRAAATPTPPQSQ
jgi:hypothetical protein